MLRTCLKEKGAFAGHPKGNRRATTEFKQASRLLKPRVGDTGW